ncbi:aspartate carbamoyltransferase [Salinarimonas rosea]|uniref:aspartate carbamoyltransferase n=1 Tax=Salinarimonas rosea TaxID=552063 RepID=UPI000419A555|nr:aspartate carbamoyltransferase [Salinarimonas rosea]
MRNTPAVRSLVSIEQLGRSDFEAIFSAARSYRAKLAQGGRLREISGKIVATVFLQPSTRTRLSFEAAALRLGGEVLSLSDPSASRAGSEWRESLADTARVLDGYADVVVVRHPAVGAATYFAEASGIPVVNAGDGAGPGSEHPTQTLIDLFTIDDLCGSPDGATICLVGDLSQRCVHSLLTGLCAFSDVSVLARTEDETRLTGEEHDRLAARGLRLRYIDDVREALRESDIVYACGHEDPAHEVPEGMRIGPEVLRSANPGIRVLHPLPRGPELPPSVDASPAAAYFEQAGNGVPVRMAVLERILAPGARDAPVPCGPAAAVPPA